MSEQLVRVEREGHLAILTMNRPERHNALNDAMGEAFSAAYEGLIHDSDVRCILLRGEGRSFCSGRDVAELGHRARDESDFDFVRAHQDHRLSQLDAPKPIVAALKGAVLGGGCEMALAADFRVAATDTYMALPEINYGLVTDTGGSQMLSTLIGPSRTKYMLMTGRRIDARTAYEWGAVDFLVEPAELDTFARDIAREVASKSPLALALTKHLIDQRYAGEVRNGMRQELIAQVAMFTSADYKEARAAIREKRKPVYRGR
ncbi:MAG: enoyl-CoA hydratase/isomerase family protein [Gammaproteobacteria bacterium]